MKDVWRRAGSWVFTCFGFDHDDETLSGDAARARDDYLRHHDVDIEPPHRLTRRQRRTMFEEMGLESDDRPFR